MNKTFIQDNSINIPVLYEDEDIIVIDKPSGISSHEAPGEKGTTVNELFKHLYVGEDTSGRDMIVHRLDKGTSGVMVLARNAAARRALVAQFSERKIEKTYLALVHGKLQPEKGTIDIPLARDTIQREKISVDPEGKPALTEYEVTEYIDDCSLVAAKPRTGRTHQIRTHLAMIGFPIVGDVRYGRKDDKITRIFLHAKRLAFTHPLNKKALAFESEIPQALERYLSTIRATKKPL